MDDGLGTGKGRRIGVVGRDEGIDVLLDLLDGSEGCARFGSAVTIKTYDTRDNVNADLVAGRIDLEMADAVNLAEFLKTDQGKDFEVKATPPQTDKVVFGYGVGGGGGVRHGAEGKVEQGDRRDPRQRHL
jgi:ABC-type amino acid transport substrate-binding protein